MNGKFMLALISFAGFLYLLATVTSHWFKLPSTSYGIWWVLFCDNLSRCQVIVAILNDQPLWYSVIQGFSLLSCLTLSAAIILFSVRLVAQYKLPSFTTQLPVISAFLFTSVISTIALVATFYTKLSESNLHDPPLMSWSTYLASISCFLQLVIASVLLITDMHVSNARPVHSVVCQKTCKNC